MKTKSNTVIKPKPETAKIPLQRLVMPFSSLPLGTKFKFLDSGNDNNYIVLSKVECGLVAKLDEPTANCVLTQIFSAFESTDELKEANVIVEQINMTILNSILCLVWSRVISADDATDTLEETFNFIGVDMCFE